MKLENLVLESVDEIIREINKKISALECPVHGTPPLIKKTQNDDGTYSASIVCCCQDQLDEVDKKMEDDQLSP